MSRVLITKYRVFQKTEMLEEHLKFQRNIRKAGKWRKREKKEENNT